MKSDEIIKIHGNSNEYENGYSKLVAFEDVLS